jgi:hypothetical protein
LWQDIVSEVTMAAMKTSFEHVVLHPRWLPDELSFFRISFD